MPCVYLPGPAPAVTVANNTDWTLAPAVVKRECTCAGVPLSRDPVGTATLLSPAHLAVGKHWARRQPMAEGAPAHSG